MTKRLPTLPGKVGLDLGVEIQSEEDKNLSKILFESVDAQDINRVKSAVQNISTSINDLHTYNYSFRVLSRQGCSISALMLAAYKGNPDIVKEILKSKFCDVNIKNNETPLMAAAAQGHVDVTRILLQDPRIGVNVSTGMRQTALNYAVRNDRPEIAKLFLDDGRFNVNETDSNSDSLLYLATDRGFVEIVKLFLANENCDVNYVNRYGSTSFHYAVCKAALDPRQERIQILELHLLRLPDLALVSGEKNPIFSFMKWVGNVSAYKTSDYYYQCIDYLTDIQTLLDEIPYILAYAIEYSTTEVCALLIKKGASVDSCFPGEEAAIFCALRNNSFSKCRLLIENGVNLAVEWLGMTPFQFAVAFACLPEIIKLLSQGLDVTAIHETLEQYSFVNETYIDCAKRLKILNLLPSQPHTTNASSRVSQNLTHAQNPKLSTLCGGRIPLKHDVTPDDSLRQLIFTSIACNTRVESKRIEAQLRVLLNFLSTKLKESKDTAHLHFRPIISGSMAEGTKTFLVDEFDVVCEFVDMASTQLYPGNDGVTIIVVDTNSPWSRDTNSKGELIVRNVSRRFYTALRQIIARTTRNKKEAAKLFGSLYLHRQSLEVKQKICPLQLMWDCNYYKRMIVHVDLVPSFPLRNLVIDDVRRASVYAGHHAIAKRSRRTLDSVSYEEAVFPFSNKCKDVVALRALPSYAKQAYIYAKAVRIADISQPDNVEELHLCDSINPEDHITSFMLKQSVFDIPKPPIGENPFGCAERIYSKYEEYIREGTRGIRTLGGAGEFFIYCRHDKGNLVVRECCQRRRVLSQLCRTIKNWLSRNKWDLWELRREEHLVYSRCDQVDSFGEFLLLN